MDHTMTEWDSVPASSEKSQSGFRKVTGKISEGISGIADRLDREALKVGANPHGPLTSIAPEIKKYGHMTAEALERSANYVRDLDLDDVKEKTRVGVQRNPGRAILIAGAAGFILGALLKRRGL